MLHPQIYTRTQGPGFYWEKAMKHLLDAVNRMRVLHNQYVTGRDNDRMSLCRRNGGRAVRRSKSSVQRCSYSLRLRSVERFECSHLFSSMPNAGERSSSKLASLKRISAELQVDSLQDLNPLCGLFYAERWAQSVSDPY